MLERIVNVDSNFDFKRQQKKSPHFDKAFLSATEAKGTSADSANFSAAAVFLQRIHWRLLKFKLFNSEKVALSFVVDNIEFETELEFSAQSTGRQKFCVYDYFFEEGKRLRCGTNYSLVRKSTHEVAEYSSLSLDNTKIYFDRAVNDSVHQDIPFSTIPEISWYEGILSGLEIEFDNIYTGALIFVEKVLNEITHQVPSARKLPAEIELERFTMIDL